MGQQNVLSLSSTLGSASRPLLGPSQASKWQEYTLPSTDSMPHSPGGRHVQGPNLVIWSPVPRGWLSRWFGKQVHFTVPGLLATFRDFRPGVVAAIGGCSHLVQAL